MQLFNLYTALMLLASIAAVIVFFTIQASPSLRSAGPRTPATPLAY